MARRVQERREPRASADSRLNAARRAPRDLHLGSTPPRMDGVVAGVMAAEGDAGSGAEGTAKRQRSNTSNTRFNPPLAPLE